MGLRAQIKMERVIFDLNISNRGFQSTRCEASGNKIIINFFSPAPGVRDPRMLNPNSIDGGRSICDSHFNLDFFLGPPAETVSTKTEKNRRWIKKNPENQNGVNKHTLKPFVA